MNKFEDKIERLKAQQEFYNEVISKRHPSDVYCPNCETHLTRLKQQNRNAKKTLKVKCPNVECNGNIEIIYETKKGRAFAIGFSPKN